jgi:hypothetical protein
LQTALDRDDEPPQSAHLDIGAGDIVWLYASDDDAERDGVSAGNNKQVRMKVESSPEKDLLIPRITQVEQLRILQEFLSSDWTIDPQVKKATQKGICWNNSWMDQAVQVSRPSQGLLQIEKAKAYELAEEFLVKQGIQPDWR